MYVTRVYNTVNDLFFMHSVLGAPDRFSPLPMASRFITKLLKRTTFCFMSLVVYFLLYANLQIDYFY